MADETLFDILNEMRTFGERCDHRPFSWQMVSGLFGRLADRLEAAAARERNRQYEPQCNWSIRDALALANTLANHGLRDGNADAASSCIYSLCRILSSPGNASALREALLRCEAISHLPEIREQQCVRDMRNIIIRALAVPPRNCDVGTAKEQAERFESFCQSNMQFYKDMFGHDDEGRLDGWDCREDCPVGRMIDAKEAVSDHCQLAWAQLPYEAEGGAE